MLKAFSQTVISTDVRLADMTCSRNLLSFGLQLRACHMLSFQNYLQLSSAVWEPASCPQASLASNLASHWQHAPFPITKSSEHTEGLLLYIHCYASL